MAQEQKLNQQGLVEKARTLLESKMKAGEINMADLTRISENYTRQQKAQITEAKQRKCFTESVAYMRKNAGLIKEANETLRKVRNYCAANNVSFDAVRKAAFK